MKNFWYEKYFGETCFYFGVLPSFRIGIVLGRESFVDLGFVYFGINLW